MLVLVDKDDVKTARNKIVSSKMVDIENIARYLGTDSTILANVILSDIKDDKEWKTFEHHLIRGELLDGLFLWHDDCKPLMPTTSEGLIMSARCDDVSKSNGAEKEKCVRCSQYVWIATTLKNTKFKGVVCEKCIKKEDQPKIVMIDKDDKNFAVLHTLGITNRDVYRSYIARLFIGKSRSGQKGKYELKAGDKILYHFSLRIPGLILFESPENGKMLKTETTEEQPKIEPNVEVSKHIEEPNVEVSKHIEEPNVEVSKHIEEHNITPKIIELENFISITKLKYKTQNINLGEVETRRSIIDKILFLLGWNIFDPEEVNVTYTIEADKIYKPDYKLEVRDFKAIIEVKKVKAPLDIHQEQLLNYSYRDGINIAILTNGLVWQFYVGISDEPWEQRRFVTINFLEQYPKAAASKLIEFFSKENALNGKAIENSSNTYSRMKRKRKLQKGIPRILNNAFDNCDPRLVNIFCDIIENSLGPRPTEDEMMFVMNLFKNQWNIKDKQVKLPDSF